MLTSPWARLQRKFDEIGVLAVGRHEATWQAGKLPSGTYFYRLTAGAFSQTKALTLLK